MEAVTCQGQTASGPPALEAVYIWDVSNWLVDFFAIWNIWCLQIFPKGMEQIVSNQQPEYQILKIQTYLFKP